jgi:hypothetical protein
MSVVAFPGKNSTGSAARLLASDSMHLIPFQPTQTCVRLEAGVVRGERDLYAVLARAGQTLSVELKDAEHNTAFSIFPPGTQISCAAERPECIGPTLTGESDSRHWSGRVPMTGPYFIGVASTWGNAAYQLSVSLR